MKSKIAIIIAFKLYVLIFFACKKQTIEDNFVGFENPKHFPLPNYLIANNNVTKSGFELGRKLFYETKLSVNNTISCGSCHQQSAAFTHPGHDVSHGIFDRLGTRNSPAIMNLAWRSNFMWDGGIFNLDLQPLAPIESNVEMGESMMNIINKLNATNIYPNLFQKAFGTNEINANKILKALSQFMIMCKSDQSKYDSVKQNLAQFNIAEQEGYVIFLNNCNICHKEPLFTSNTFRNNGLSVSTFNDKGRYNVTLNNNDLYKFQVPSLRNLSYTSPYMHDGRFYNLDAVLDHYTNNIINSITLDSSLYKNNRLGIPLTNTEKDNLKTFLLTLNDKKFITNKLLSEQ